jgi:hypothetical protein
MWRSIMPKLEDVVIVEMPMHGIQLAFVQITEGRTGGVLHLELPWQLLSRLFVGAFMQLQIF